MSSASSTVESTVSALTNETRTTANTRGGRGRNRGRRSGQAGRGAARTRVSSTFKGSTPDMEGYVFECYEEQTDRRQYNRKTVEALECYVKKTMRYPEDLAPLFATDSTLSVLAKPPRPLLVPPATVAAKDDIEIWKEDLRHLSKRKNVLRGNLSAIHAVIWGQCSEAMHVKLRSIDGYEENRNADDCKCITKLLVVSVVADVVRCLNMLPAPHGVSPTLSPLSIVTGAPGPDYNAMKLEFGSYVQLFDDADPTNTLRSRTFGAISLNATGNLGGDYYFLSLASGARVSRHRYHALPIPNTAIARVEALAKSENQPLLQERGLVVEWRPDHPIDEDEYDRDFLEPPEADDDSFDADDYSDVDAAELADLDDGFDDPPPGGTAAGPNIAPALPPAPAQGSHDEPSPPPANEEHDVFQPPELDEADDEDLQHQKVRNCKVTFRW